MIYYTSDGRSFTGMDQATVEDLLVELGWAGTFVDKSVYDAYMASIQRLPS